MAENAGQIQTPEPNKISRRISAAVPVFRWLLRWKTLVPLVLLITVGVFSTRLLGAVRQNQHYQKLFCQVQTAPSAEQPQTDTSAGSNSAFKPSSRGQLISSQTLLKLVGRSPGEPDRSLFSALEKAGAEGTEDAPAKDATPPAAPADPVVDTKTPPATGTKNKENTEQPPAAGPSRVGQNPPPVEKAIPEEHASVPAVEPTSEAQPQPEAGPTGTKAPDRNKDAVQRPPATVKSGEKDPGIAPEDADNRQEKFQLPGSLIVNIPDYKGSLMRVGLLVILENSADMGSKTKTWGPNRISLATDVMSKIAKALPPGSKIAVRDFLCNKPSGSGTAPPKPCPCRKLYEWSKAPFEGLKAKLDNVSTGGANNPCAAAAYAAKGDFSGIGDLVPRILIITSGARKCAANEVLKAIKESGIKSHPPVDVVTIGNHKKTAKGYATLASKTGGANLKAEKPADLNLALARYEKILAARTFEKIEVRGEKAMFSIVPNQEIPLAPGAYKIILPAIQGLVPAHREIRNVKIESGQNSSIEVKIRKGKPTLKMGRN